MTNRLIAELIKRPARTLARTKRAVNKTLVQQINLAYDGLAHAEMLDFWEQGRDNWEPDLAFRRGQNKPTGSDEAAPA